MFKRHRYPRVVILHAVYLKLRFTLSYRELEEGEFKLIILLFKDGYSNSLLRLKRTCTKEKEADAQHQDLEEVQLLKTKPWCLEYQSRRQGPLSLQSRG
jgi:transposase-like protein